MAISNYSQLKTAVADWLNRDDMVSVIPSFISLAEAGIERVLRTKDMLVRTNLTIDSQYESVPADFLEVRSMQLTSAVPSRRVDFVTMDEMDSMDSNAASQPRFFTVVGDDFRFYPIPGGSYTATLNYFAKLSKLSDINTTNWLLTSSPDVYLYGALMQAAPYLKDDERINVWSNLYVSAIQQLQTADERGATTGGVLKSRVLAFGRR
jgi:hypothetical protein